MKPSHLAALAALSTLMLLGGCSGGEKISSDWQVAQRSMLSAAFTRNGEQVFVGAMRHGGSLWETKNQERKFNWNLEAEALSAFRGASFSDDNKYLAATEQNALALWDTETGEAIRYWQTPFKILSLSLAKQYVLLGQENNYAVLFDVVAGGVIGSMKHKAPVSSVAINDNADLALTGSHDGMAQLWSLKTGESLEQYPQSDAIDYVLLSPSGRQAFIVSYQGGVVLHQTQTEGLAPLVLYKKNIGILSARFNDAEDKLLLGTSREKVILWDLKRKEIAQQWRLEQDNPRQPAAVIALSFANQGFKAAASNGKIYQF